MAIKQVKKYLCPICGRLYDTEEEAESCNSGFIPQVGDTFIVDGNPKIVYKVNEFLYLGTFRDYTLAKFGTKSLHSDDGVSFAFPCWRKLFCKTSYGSRRAIFATTDEMDLIINNCKERIEAAERAKKLIEAMEERHEEGE